MGRLESNSGSPCLESSLVTVGENRQGNLPSFQRLGKLERFVQNLKHEVSANLSDYNDHAVNRDLGLPRLVKVAKKRLLSGLHKTETATFQSGSLPTR